MRALLAQAGGIPVDRAHGVVMNVAITDMAKRAMAHARTSCCEGGISARDEVSDARNGHGHVVGDAAACGLLGFDQAFSHPPELCGLCAGGSEQSIADELPLQRRSQSV